MRGEAEEGREGEAQIHLVAIERIHQKRQKITVQVQVCHGTENTRSLTQTHTHAHIHTYIHSHTVTLRD